MRESLANLEADEAASQAAYETLMAALRTAEADLVSEVTRLEGVIADLSSQIAAQEEIVAEQTRIRDDAQDQWNTVNAYYNSELEDAAKIIAISQQNLSVIE